ncbi:MAG: TraR/DksA family transcriptional regulator [Proteobacteria bacterium]|nr:MAG: TraR/DksA family transcriptional regulator [Pseudomonadota bacterium]
MTEEELEQFRIRLERMRSDIEQTGDASRQSASTVELDQSSVGRLSRMDAMQAQQVARELVARREEQSRRIDGALRRISRGDYGCCFVCGEEIDPNRLRADPTLTRCIGCASA